MTAYAFNGSTAQDRALERLEERHHLPEEPAYIHGHRSPKEVCVRAALEDLILRHDPNVRFRYRRPRVNHDESVIYTWNPANQTLAPACDTYESALHDIAHWLTASPHRRTVPEFGLGSDPYRTHSDADQKRFGSSRQCEAIEYETCLVQALLGLTLHFSLRSICSEVSMRVPTLRELDRVRQRYPHAMRFAEWEYVTTALKAAYA